MEDSSGDSAFVRASKLGIRDIAYLCGKYGANANLQGISEGEKKEFIDIISMLIYHYDRIKSRIDTFKIQDRITLLMAVLLC